jgi:ESCRT-I complex subunit TSG101
MAIEDTFYILDKALTDGRIDLQNFVKIVRSLSRKQFYERALASRIIQKQVELQQQASPPDNRPRSLI